MMPEGVERRLRAHVASVLASSHVPSTERDDLAEELYGHLVERWQSLVAGGDDPMEATRNAIRGFGGAERIGQDLTRTYRGRFWASTIGVLLPGGWVAGRPPSVSLLLVLACGMAAVLALQSGWYFVNRPPIHALLSGGGSLIAAAAVLITALGLLRARRWAVTVAVAGSSALALAAVSSFHERTFSVSGALAAIALVCVAIERTTLMRWVTPGRVPRRATALVLAMIVAAPAGAVAASAVDDPTQATAADLDLRLDVHCDTVDSERLGIPVHEWRVAVSWSWQRTSLLPGGIAGHVAAQAGYTDALMLRHPGEEWTLQETIPPVEARSTASVGWQGAGSPSQDVRPTDFVSAVIDYAIRSTATQPGTTYRASWVMQGQRRTSGWPATAEVWYVHGDQWHKTVWAGCG